MREDYYADYYEFEQYNWWFVSRRTILRALLRKFLPGLGRESQILDAGCGTGINIELLERFGDVTGIDSSDEAIRFCHLRDADQAQKAEIQSMPFDDHRFDLVTALDVLEHIEEDGKALSEISRVCKPGGHILITVPVFPSLWGEHDEINQHVRRYEPGRLLTMLDQCGFTVIHQSYMNTWLFPAAFAWRWFRNIRRWFVGKENRLARADNMHHHPLLNRILTWIFTSELPIVIGPGLPVGLSLVVLGKKK